VVRSNPGAGDVAAVPLPDGAFGACQVTGVEDRTVVVCALAWYSTRSPTLGELDGVGPLVLDHHAHGGQPAHINVGRADPVPPGFAWLGNLPVTPDLPAVSDSSAGWWWLPAMITAQHRWDVDVPASEKQAYRASATRGHVEVDFGAGPVTLGAATARLDLTGAGPIPVPASGPVRWSALDDLGCCTSLVWSGPDRGLTAVLAARPLIASLSWNDAPADIDLSGSGLVSVRLAGARTRRLRLPRSSQELELADDVHLHEVTAHGHGRWLRLVIDSVRPDPVIPDGLGEVRNLVFTGDGVISAAPLRALPDLETLRLAWRAAPGQLTNSAALAALGQLAAIEIFDGYALDAGTLPDLPALTSLNIYGIRRSVAAALTARYRRGDVDVVIGGAKSDTWLAANLTNPFRDWTDDDAHGGAAACKAYADAVRAVDKLPAEQPRQRVEAQRILRTLVDRLNHIDARYGFIDTLRREQAGDAFVDLAGRVGVPADLADTWFDEWRDF